MSSIGSLSEGALAMTTYSYVTVVKHAARHDAAAALGTWAGTDAVISCQRHVRCEYQNSDPRAMVCVLSFFP